MSQQQWFQKPLSKFTDWKVLQMEENPEQMEVGLDQIQSWYVNCEAGVPNFQMVWSEQSCLPNPFLFDFRPRNQMNQFWLAAYFQPTPNITFSKKIFRHRYGVLSLPCAVGKMGRKATTQARRPATTQGGATTQATRRPDARRRERNKKFHLRTCGWIISLWSGVFLVFFADWICLWFADRWKLGLCKPLTGPMKFSFTKMLFHLTFIHDISKCQLNHIFEKQCSILSQPRELCSYT